MYDVTLVARFYVETLRRRIRWQDYSSRVETILFFPTLLRSDVPGFGEFVSYQDRGRSVLVGRNLNFPQWKRSSRQKRVDLFGECLRDSIDAISELKMSARDKDQFKAALQKGRTSVIKRLPSA
jgi:hypothetical protein